jgi:aryl-alcohol dehydrogenase-like predicted oxidoreductase
VESLQPQLSLIDRAAEDEVLPYAEAEEIGVIVYAPWPRVSCPAQ